MLKNNTYVKFNVSEIYEVLFTVKNREMKNTEGQIIAQEIWNMLPDSCKEIMENLRYSFMDSIASDVDHVVNKISLNLPVSRSAIRVEFQVQAKSEHECEKWGKAKKFHKKIYVKHGLLPQIGDWIACDDGDYSRVVGAQWVDINHVIFWLDDEIR